MRGWARTRAHPPARAEKLAARHAAHGEERRRARRGRKARVREGEGGAAHKVGLARAHAALLADELLVLRLAVALLVGAAQLLLLGHLERAIGVKAAHLPLPPADLETARRVLRDLEGLAQHELLVRVDLPRQLLVRALAPRRPRRKLDLALLAATERVVRVVLARLLRASLWLRRRLLRLHRIAAPAQQRRAGRKLVPPGRRGIRRLRARRAGPSHGSCAAAAAARCSSLPSSRRSPRATGTARGGAISVSRTCERAVWTTRQAR